MDEYCAYLRKSRADYEAEQRGEGETLARHKKMLQNTAKAKGIVINKYYCEIVSGETISSRPQMQQLLKAVEAGLWKGVLVVEVERLARGDTTDQGTVQRVFRVTNTKIITPLKEYDPTNESDNEYFEFGLFMSRREYNTIKRRLKNGRTQAALEGKWPFRTAPYGYEVVKIPKDKGFTLEIKPEEADIVKLIFEWYTKGYPNLDGTKSKIGMQMICNKLNEMNIKPRLNDHWTLPTIASMLGNPVYTGKVKIGYNPTVEIIQNGVILKKREKNKNYQTVPGLHSAIIDEETFEQVKNIRSKNPAKPLKENSTMKNPLSGLVECSYCGRKMIRRPFSNRSHKDTLICPLPGCKNIGADLCEVEELIIVLLEKWLKDYEIKWSTNSKANADYTLSLTLTEKAMEMIQSELSDLELQLSNLHDLLERGIYDDETFLARRQKLIIEKKGKEKKLAKLEKTIVSIKAHEKSKVSLIPNVKYAIETYQTLTDPKQKNELLSSVIDKIIYTKDAKCARGESKAAHIKLQIHPKLPR